LKPAANINWQLIRLLAARCERAYDEASISDAATDTQALVVYENGKIIVAFRGSSSIKDFLQDAECWKEDLISNARGTAAVHHGFLEGFNAIDEAVVSRVKIMLGLAPQAKIYLTGHSLGGALALLGALEFSRQGLPVAGVVTFGQPRVGNKVFAALYDAAPSVNQQRPAAATLRDVTFRVVNQNDIVPRTPGLLLGYRHCGQEIFLQPGTGWGVNPSTGYKIVCDALGLWGAFRTRGDVLVREHFLAAYQRRIQFL